MFPHIDNMYALLCRNHKGSIQMLYAIQIQGAIRIFFSSSFAEACSHVSSLTWDRTHAPLQ